ncbi:MAG: GNAT family N-acetyltransferase [Vicinamibacterales bacterium]
MSTLASAYPFVDLTLARRLEGAEGRANARFVEARAVLAPGVGATWVEVAGAKALFDGVGSPLTQTFGLGLFDEVTDADFETIERFFTSRGADVHHEVSPLAPPSFPARLGERGYRPIELTSVLYRPLGPASTIAAPVGPLVRQASAEEADIWARVAAEGWSATPELQAFVEGIGTVGARSVDRLSFLAELDGRPVGAAALASSEGVALLAGASTIPSARNRGVQLALLDTRLRVAASLGCDLAMMGAQPGSASQRNAERHGFRVAYTRIKWQRFG